MPMVTLPPRTGAGVAEFILEDPWRRAVLETVRGQRLADWAVGAGFVRSAIWDALHGYAKPTPLSDVDVLFFDPADTSRDRESAIEHGLTTAMPNVPWSVKNQARMHRRNGDNPYADTCDALRYWLETPTAVAIRLDDDGRASLLAPFDVDDLVAMVCRPTPRGREKLREYQARMRAKNWPALWPRVAVWDLGPGSGPPASF